MTAFITLTLTDSDYCPSLLGKCGCYVRG